jgi:hypothetical protein
MRGSLLFTHSLASAQRVLPAIPHCITITFVNSQAHRPAYLPLAAEKLAAALGENLFGVVLYGSYARGEAGEWSDVDLLVIARGLPEQWYERNLHLHQILKKIPDAPDFSILGKTPEEFEQHFPSLYLDIGLDGIVLFDRNNYTAHKLARIREIIKQAGLARRRLSKGNMFWNWDRKVTRQWAITWEGFHEFA